ncbi:MAG: HD domain-containing protein [Bacteriovorax sp.]|nr:HD domain-containing protein [Bacteriovorax sp.]
MSTPMPKSQFINKLGPKDEVLSPFLVKHIATAEGKDGKSYLNIILADKSGELEARKWHGADLLIGQIRSGDVVIVGGKMNQFQGRMQLIVADMSKLNEDQFNREDYIQKAGSAPEKMFQELIAIVETLEEIYIKDLLLSVLHDPEIARRLKVWQAGKSIHHAYQSGLLEHIFSCTKLAVILSPHYKVNRSYVVAGCVLHDICKIYELSEGPVVEYTEEGKLVGHLVKALEVVDEHAYKIKNFPYNIKLHLKHILLSHHGEYEYGSPKTPSTSEAFLVHLIDLMDSKMSSLEQVKKNDNSSGHWSGFVKHLNRIVYKSELPSFTNYVKDGENSQPPAPAPAPAALTKPKGTLGNLLKDFKVEE